MAILIGVDEAGYGPNYGPLVVAATAWRGKAESGRRKGEGSHQTAAAGGGVVGGGGSARAVAATATRYPDLYKVLRKAVVRSPSECPRRMAIADSKALYKAGLGVGQLERGVLAALACVAAARGGGTLPANGGFARGVGELLAATGVDALGRRCELPCHAGDAQELPLEAVAEEICRLAELLHRTCERQGVALLAIRARLVYPAEFNELVDRYGTKGAALSHVTLELVRRVVDEVQSAEESRDVGGAGGGDAPARWERSSTIIFFDKHGGRNRYAGLLQHHFAESWVDTLAEGRAESRYAWRHREAPVEAVFRVGCEELLPTALASMTAKYHRELAMRAFNAWWTQHVPELRPTAGYPRDAHRFRADIATAQRELGIDDRSLWRSR